MVNDNVKIQEYQESIKSRLVNGLVNKGKYTVSFTPPPLGGVNGKRTPKIAAEK